MNTESKIAIHSLTRQELVDWCANAGEPRFRAPQIWNWLYVERVGDWSRMTNLPAELRRKLADAFRLGTVTRLEAMGEPGTTQKMLLRLADNETIETVLIPARGRLTVCLSTQLGCKYSCAFCASGQSGYRRNLDAAEMIEQLLLAADTCGKPPTHVVFMGIGEPLDNYEQVLKAIRILNDEEGLRIGARRITISTCGIIPGINRLADEGLQLELSVSLHAPDNALRTSLMPVNRRYPITELLKACDAYAHKTGRIITFEYAMIRGVNDSREHASKLAALLRPLPCRVNLIPLSPVAEFSGAPSGAEACALFANILERAGINATLRKSRGVPLHAACGQLRANRSAVSA